MFVQGRPILDRVGGGLGIGLALSRRIAELHGGTLKAHSEGAGQGSEFTRSMPLTGDLRTPTAKQPAIAAVSHTDGPVQKRVLVVDDNADAADTMALLLMSMGHISRVARSGGEALEHIGPFRPDIVLLDIGLPDVDGYEVARQLRLATIERPVRIVAVTGWGQEADRERARESGFDLHLVKPVDTTALAQALGE